MFECNVQLKSKASQTRKWREKSPTPDTTTQDKNEIRGFSFHTSWFFFLISLALLSGVKRTSTFNVGKKTYFKVVISTNWLWFLHWRWMVLLFVYAPEWSCLQPWARSCEETSCSDTKLYYAVNQWAPWCCLTTSTNPLTKHWKRREPERRQQVHLSFINSFHRSFHTIIAFCINSTSNTAAYAPRLTAHWSHI